jgi:cysteine desulfurase / selenocysteine lyase
MGVTTQVRLDAQKLRTDFPIFEQPMHGKPLAYLDSANSSQKPRQVLDAVRDFYETSYANVHRAVYELGGRATEAYEGARDKAHAFVNAESRREVIFTKGATEALNLVAYAWGLDNLGPGDTVLVTELEHHSNFVPWQYIAGRTGADFAAIPIDGSGELALDGLDELARTRRIKVLACGLVSNSLGTINPVERLGAWAHDQGAIMVVDACQAAPHRRIDVQALGCDFLAFTGHKMLGPMGVGVLAAREEVLQGMEPFLGGGEMIRDVTIEGSTWNDIPWRFEAGTPNVAEAVGLGAAVDYLRALGMDRVRAAEADLTAYALKRLGEVQGLRVYGPAEVEHRGGVVSFTLGSIHPHDVAQVLDEEGIAVRAGHHCTMPLHRRLGVQATTRASFSVYSTADEVDALVAGLEKAARFFA